MLEARLERENGPEKNFKHRAGSSCKLIDRPGTTAAMRSEFVTRNVAHRSARPYR